jgi:hypothetical protein
MTQRLLLAKAAENAAMVPDIVAVLKPLLSRRGRDDVGNDPSVVHAVWILAELGLFRTDPATWNPILKGLLLHPAAGARRNVLMAMPRTAQSAQVIKDQGRVNDPDAHVRLQALIALSEIPDKVDGIAMFSDYRNIDQANMNGTRESASGTPAPWANIAFADAGIFETPTLPSIPSLDVVSSDIRPFSPWESPVRCPWACGRSHEL